MKGLLSLLFLLALWSINSQKNIELINEFLFESSKDLHLAPSDYQHIVVTDESYSILSNTHHIYVNQTFNGIEILKSGGNFAIKDNEITFFNLQLISEIEAKVNTINYSINARKAIDYALAKIGALNKSKIDLLQSEEGKNKYLFSKGDVSVEDIPVELVYVRTELESKPLRLAWDLSIYERTQKHWWSIKIDATNGSVLDMNDWVLECTFEGNDKKSHVHVVQCNSNLNTKANLPPPTGSYNVFALPLESPNHGNRSLVSGTENLTASPFGWHDDDGSAGAEYTITRGNNVFAYEDQDDNNAPGYSPDGGALLDFDFPLDLNNDPSTNLDPVITNLFYMNNIMHDVWYQYGFDEVSGNFQQNNYGNGGIGSDYVFAEAQDGGGLNNANFATPGDGGNPRMQMYLWSAPTANNNLLEINSPSSLSGPYQAVQAGFGPSVPTTPLTADFVLVDDNTGDNEDACEAIVNAADLNGKIAVIRRGSCTFVLKVEAAEAAGAVAVIMVNNVAGAPITMGGADPGIGIPSVMVSQADGEAIISALLSSTSINGTLQSSGNLVQLDGDFDNGIIAHEYGHGISTRLTGGPSNSNCLNNDEQMGEGWSDWFGLMLTIEPGDLGEDIRGIGTYAIGEPTNGNGIRPAPYSTDLAVNDYTYAATNNTGAISQPHGVGFVWCTMLWDLTWALINSYGYDPDLYEGTGGNNIAMALVIEALKLQACNPGFVDGRDAILQADQLLYSGANECLIWQVFAARGLGFSADQGSSASRTDQTEAFDLPPACQLPTVPPTAAFTFLADCNGQVNFTDESTNNPDSWSWDFGDGNSSSLENPSHVYSSSGTYNVELISTNIIGSGSSSISVTVVLPDAPVATDASICQNETITLTGSGSGTLNWYDNTGTILLETGNTFTTPNLLTTTNYLVQNVIEQSVEFVGPQDGSIGSGGFHNQPVTFALNFDASVPFNLISVWVDANSTGNRTINLYDGIDGGGAVIDQVTVNITSTGPQRITLDLDVPSAGSYSLGGVSMDLYRNNGGVNYPYFITDVVSVVSSSVGTDYYYYFYDWEIQTSPCLSPFTNVVATVNPTVQSTDIQSACGSFTWIDGNTYNSNNGDATYTLQSANGCDSIVTLNLTIYNPSFGTDVQSACDSYTWIDGNTYTTSNNSATYTVQNSQGCDSVITLNLNISNSSFSTDIQSSCGPFTWIDGNTYTTSNNLATYTIQNSQGCDSTITLNLTINSPSFITDTHISCGPFTWIDGNTYSSSNNTATFTLQNTEGCDSTIALNLVVNEPSFGTDIQTACNSYTWIDGITYTTNNNSAIYTLQNINGCDSTITLDLTINTVNNNVLQLGPGSAQAEVSNASYQWIDCDNAFSELQGEINQTFECQGPCSYNVAVAITQNNCTDTSECIVLSVLDIDEDLNPSEITLYPNPSSNLVYIRGLNHLQKVEKIELLDYNGRSIQVYLGTTNSFDVQFLTDGVYFLNISHQEGNKILRLTIQ